jgi:hypothetical protein
MEKSKLSFRFFLPFIGAIPVLILALTEENIIEAAGRNTYVTLLVVFISLAVVLSLFPVFRLFKGLFGGKGYNFFWGRGKLAKQIIATGKSASARLVSIDENSGGGYVTINDQPLLNLTFSVTEGDQPPYEIKFDTIVPRVLLPQLQPGTILPVKVDPYDKNLVVYNEAGASEIQKPTIGGKGWTDEDRRLLEQSGIDAMAMLQSFEDTGKSENFKLIAIIQYEVFIPGKEPYEVRKEIPVPADAVHVMRAAVGKTFKCRVHPADPQKIVVDVSL